MPDKKTIVITGASGGIGAALARVLADEGHSLSLVARREKELNEVGSEAQREGAGAVACIIADVTRRDDVERIARETIVRFGSFDVWVNNVGRGITRDVLDLTDADIDEMIAANVKSAVYGMQVAAKHFLSRDAGQIINVSSFLGRVPLASFRSAYSASKAMLNSLTANLRTDLAATSTNIHVTLVMPGVVTTDFSRNVVGEARPPVAGGKGPPTQTAAEVAKVIASVIRKPVAEVYTNPALLPLVRAYQEDIAAFETRMRAP
jgi:short-subunit dehydrogenase